MRATRESVGDPRARTPRLLPSRLSVLAESSFIIPTLYNPPVVHSFSGQSNTNKRSIRRGEHPLDTSAPTDIACASLRLLQPTSSGLTSPRHQHRHQHRQPSERKSGRQNPLSRTYKQSILRDFLATIKIQSPITPIVHRSQPGTGTSSQPLRPSPKLDFTSIQPGLCTFSTRFPPALQPQARPTRQDRISLTSCHKLSLPVSEGSSADHHSALAVRQPIQRRALPASTPLTLGLAQLRAQRRSTPFPGVSGREAAVIRYC
ncbi:hypothetical protein B0J14DRAFT_568308 [Halenospora varia]|nr:hypothetical protein B0J14DRAFT_568308 [Halenospora varia]